MTGSLTNKPLIIHIRETLVSTAVVLLVNSVMYREPLQCLL